jgi:hypothetical protein
VLPAAIGGILFSVGVKETYDDQIRRFWLKIRDDWLAHERMLDGNPPRRSRASARDLVPGMAGGQDRTAEPSEPPRAGYELAEYIMNRR